MTSVARPITEVTVYLHEGPGKPVFVGILSTGTLALRKLPHSKDGTIDVEGWEAVALTVLVNNVDDHWRNHSFLRMHNGWRLSPVFDVNPSPRRGVVYSRAISDSDDPRNRDIRSHHAIADAYG